MRFNPFRQPYPAFSQGIYPILVTMHELTLAWQNALTPEANNEKIAALEAKNKMLSQQLWGKKSAYPNWVYKLGFNPYLRSSFRYYLIQVERLADLFYEASGVIKLCGDISLLTTQIEAVLIGNQLLFEMLIQYFKVGEYLSVEREWEQDIDQLELAFKSTLSVQVDFMDVYPEDIALMTLVEVFKDMRKVLLALCLGLPA